MRTLCVIPSRYASTRLPAKPLAEIAGQPMIRRVYERAVRASRIDDVLVATDDARIAAVVRDFGGQVMLTRTDHASGTERVAEVAARTEADCYINVQGDEPFVRPGDIDRLVAMLESRPDCEVVSLYQAMDPAERDDPAAVKVVCRHDGTALYFSRAPIPYPRQPGAAYRKHIGLYGYRRSFLLRHASLPASPLAEAESLEQLRFLQAGVTMLMGETTPLAGPSVDTPEDLERVRALWGTSADPDAAC